VRQRRGGWRHGERRCLEWRRCEWRRPRLRKPTAASRKRCPDKLRRTCKRVAEFGYRPPHWPRSACRIAVASVNIWRRGRPPSRSAVAQNRRDITSAQPVSELQLVNQRGGWRGACDLYPRVNILSSFQSVDHCCGVGRITLVLSEVSRNLQHLMGTFS